MQPRGARVGGDSRRLVEEPVHAAVARDHAVLEPGALPRFGGPRLLGQHPCAVVGVQYPHKEVGVGGPFLSGVPQRGLEVAARVDV